MCYSTQKVDGLKNIIAAKIPYVISDMEENLAYLFVEGMNQTRGLLDMKRVEETWTTVKRQIQNLIVSFDLPPFQNRGFSNATFAEKLHDKIIELISQIQIFFVVSLYLRILMFKLFYYFHEV